jgi:hypothetical protein
MFRRPQGCRSACFANVAPATFTGNANDTVPSVTISFRSGFRESTPKSVFGSEVHPNFISISDTFVLR